MGLGFMDYSWVLDMLYVIIDLLQFKEKFSNSGPYNLLDFCLKRRNYSFWFSMWLKPYSYRGHKKKPHQLDNFQKLGEFF
jgi:hypothetical protein